MDNQWDSAPQQTRTWEQLMALSKVMRAETRKAMSLPFSKVDLVPSPDGYAIYALGTAPGKSHQTVLSTNVNSSRPLSLSSVYESDLLKSTNHSLDFSLMCERQRTSVVNGVTEYAVHPSGKVLLLSTGEHLLKVTDSAVHPVARDPKLTAFGAPSFIFDAQISPSDPSYISYVMNKQVHVENDTGLIYSTSSQEEHVTNGEPAFITQEELDRFNSVWWSPTKTRLLYERVDQSKVDTLSFACPGHPPPTPMKYPVAGSKNATSELRIIDIENGKVKDVGLKTPLYAQYPWMEYVVRAGFLNDGRTVWAVIMDRAQTRSCLVIIPECSFDGFDDLHSPVPKSVIVREEVSTSWINYHNLTIPLDIPSPASIKFIFGTEEMSQCHFILIDMSINKQKETVETKYFPITAGDFTICKSTQPVVDSKRNNIFYVANYSDPTEWNICVSNYDLSSGQPKLRQLTPSGYSFRIERAYHKLCLIPDVGFICWLTSLTQPHVCQFYSLSYNNHDNLPEANFVTTITTYGCSLLPPIASNYPEILKFKSKNSGFMHMAMVIRPTNYDPSKKHPVVQFVYGGPGIQVVRNDHTAWISFQKFTRLGYVVVMIDGRGSSNRGHSFEAPIKNNMGNCEVEDQVEGLKEVARLTNGLMDLSRVVIQGWSYGGYMSLLCLAKYSEVYRGAIAGGAVTDWRLYDTAYTERYLGYPLGAQYDTCSVLKLVEQLPDEPGRLLLLHGLMDENVHFRHAEALIEALIKASKPYQLQIYPSERHGVRSPSGASHLDATMLYFIQNLLK
ncbi:unnamed protein product [Auanema sp. JU1783]|nr:unnamed protein product [Auanema sp. JU1783]